MIIDTDVLIWSMRGNKKAAIAISENSPFSITWITYMELLKGARNKSELKEIIEEIKRKEIKVLHASAEQSALAISILRDYHHSNSLDIADAINSAVALGIGEELMSSNARHYSAIKGLKFVEFHPYEAAD